ncbi:hypothetical protein WN51_03679 [Melipona quadrifasciata]|uniref:Uncharacterized protein n=1 Tax=Melipona quadrifasciata TaxID=166423 RepID=A0A0N0U3S4_9HYME|nr:hypothetical protein WN51_03679 [Melipona quadrifasciata]
MHFYDCKRFGQDLRLRKKDLEGVACHLLLFDCDNLADGSERDFPWSCGGGSGSGRRPLTSIIEHLRTSKSRLHNEFQATKFTLSAKCQNSLSDLIHMQSNLLVRVGSMSQDHFDLSLSNNHLEKSRLHPQHNSFTLVTLKRMNRTNSSFQSHIIPLTDLVVVFLSKLGLDVGPGKAAGLKTAHIFALAKLQFPRDQSSESRIERNATYIPCSISIKPGYVPWTEFVTYTVGKLFPKEVHVEREIGGRADYLE